jgi:hypothetical protein
MRKLTVVPICRNPSALPLPPNQRQIPRRPVPHEGRFAIVTDVRRDAVDAGSASDEGADLRTAKSCGPDAPTLASSWWRQLRRRGWQTSPVTRESTKETVKTIARGMPGDSGVTVVTTLVCSLYFACEAAGASSARHSLRPLISDGRRFGTKLARRRGEIAKLCLLHGGLFEMFNPDERSEIRDRRRPRKTGLLRRFRSSQGRWIGLR